MKVLVTPARNELDVVEVPTPTPSAGEVLIRVEAATVNPVDLMVVAGVFHDVGAVQHAEPLGLGWDAVGLVVALGDGVDAFAMGDRVAGVRVGFDTPSGALAEFLSLPAGSVAAVPAGLEPAEAATIGMNALTAAQALDLAGDARGRTLLVTGAAGSVGGHALDLAVDAGWLVTGLARESDRAFVTGRGAALVTEPDDTTYDVVFDAGAIQFDSESFDRFVVPSIAPGGTFVSVLGALPPPVIEGVTVEAVHVEADGVRLEQLLKRAEAGQLVPRVAGTVSLERATEALAAVGRPGGRGRWVVLPG